MKPHRVVLFFAAFLIFIAGYSLLMTHAFDNQNTVTIPKAEYEQLKSDAKIVQFLKACPHGAKYYPQAVEHGPWQSVPAPLGVTCVPSAKEAVQRHKEYPFLFDENGNPK